MSDSQALNILMKSPVTPEMINHLVNVTLKVVPCKKSKTYPSPPSSPSSHSSKRNQLPSLMTFISRIVRYTNVYTGTLLCTQVYLERLSSKLPKNAEGLPCTLHRLFLACLIISAKFNNDSSPKNKHWTRYTDGLFKLEDVNLMERQLLQLMNWDITVTEEELARSLKRMLDPIKQDLKQTARYRRAIHKHRNVVNCVVPKCPLPSPMDTPTAYYQTKYPVYQQQQQQQQQQQHGRSMSASSISSLSSSSSMDSISSIDTTGSSSYPVNVKVCQLYPSQQKKQVLQQEEKFDDLYLPSIWAWIKIGEFFIIQFDFWGLKGLQYIGLV